MFFDRIFTPPPAPSQRSGSLENPSVSIHDADAWSESFGYGTETDAGEAVSAESAISLSGFWSAVKIISGDVSRMPLQTARKQPGGAKAVPDNSHYLMDLIGLQGMANEDISALKLWRRAMVQALIYENAYLWMDRGGSGRILGVYLLLSDRTATVRYRGKTWVVTECGDEQEGRQIVVRPYHEVLHIEGLCLDGLAGSQLVRQAREDIGTALASRKFKAKFFGQGMHAGGVLHVPPGATTKSQQKIEKALEEQHTSTNKAFRALVLRDNFKWHSTQVHPEQAQLTEIDEAGVRDLARRFLIRPSRLGVKDSNSYYSLAMDRRDYYDGTLAYWLSMVESELATKALTTAERRIWEIGYAANLALLFADAQTLSAIGLNGINARDAKKRSVFERNEVRGWFGLRPLDDDEAAGPATDPEPDPDDDDPADDAQDDDDSEDDDSETRSAHRALLAAEFGRIVRRLNVHAQRAAAKGPAELQTWRDDMESSSHYVVACEALTPMLSACRAVGLAAEYSDGEVVDLLFAMYQRDVDGIIGGGATHLESELAEQLIP